MKRFYLTILLFSAVFSVFGQLNSVIVNNDEGECGATVNGISPVWNFAGWESALVIYIIDGATSGVGSDDASGTFFNNGSSMLTYFAVSSDSLTVLDTLYIQITVNDTELPVANCKDITVELDENGNADIEANQVNDASTDNCGIVNYTTNTSNFSCENEGDNTISLTVLDAAGNSASCQSTVTVEDDWSPVLKLNPLEINLYDHGEYVLTEKDKRKIVEGSVDNCTSGELDIVVFPNSFECVHVGDSVTVQVFVSDENGNRSQGTTKVWVNDFTTPVAICKDIEVLLDDNGEARIFAGQINASENRESTPEWARTFNHLEGGSYDACGVYSMQLDRYKFDCGDVGENTVTLTTKDASGNIGTCQATVTVISNINPNVVCKDITVELDENGEAFISDKEIVDDLKGVCGVADVTITPQHLTCADLGEKEITISVRDNSENLAQCTAKAIIVDNEAPVFVQQNNIEITVEPGVCETAINDYPEISAFDNCDVELNLLNGLGKDGLFLLGTSTETWQATDAAGNSVEMAFDVIVSTYNAPPTINLIPDISINKDSGAVIVPVAGIGTGIDCETQEIENIEVTSSTPEIASATLSFESGAETAEIEITPVAKGSAEVTVVVTDNGGTDNGGVNSKTIKFNVTVEENEVVTLNPWANCENALLELDENGQASLNSEQINLKFGDFDGSENVVFSTSEFDCDNLGENIVEVTISDESGNTATCNSVVTIEDNIVPTITQVDDINIVVEPGMCETSINAYPQLEVNDNCNTKLELVSGKGPEGSFPLGTTTETWRVSDDFGNESEISFNINLTTYNDAPTIDDVNDLVISKDSGAVEIELTGITTGNDCENQRIIGVIVSSSNKSVLTASVVYKPGDSTAKLTLTPGEAGKVNVTVVVLDNGGKENGGTDLATLLFKVEVAESKKATDAPIFEHIFDFKMYPNPTSGNVFFDVKSTNPSDVGISIYSMTGEKVIDKYFRPGENMRINMNGNISGMYIVKIETEGKQIIKKLVLEEQ